MKKAILFLVFSLPLSAQVVIQKGVQVGGPVTSINGSAGAYTFTGSGVSCSGAPTYTCTFNGGGLPSGVTSPGAGSLTGTGTFQAALQDAGGEVFSVKAYGATGNGSTNDCTAITNTIAAQTTAGYGEIFFPQGNYYVGASCRVTISAGGKLVGTGNCGQNSGTCGTTITSSDPTGVLFTVTADNFDFDSIALVNTSTPTAGAGVEATSSTDALAKVSFHHTSISGFYDNLDHWVGALWTFEDSRAYAPQRYNIYVQNTLQADYGDWSITNSALNLQGSSSHAALANIYIASSNAGRIENSQVIGDNLAVSSQCGIDANSATAGNGLNIENVNANEYALGSPICITNWNQVIATHNNLYTTGSNTSSDIVATGAAALYIAGGILGTAVSGVAPITANSGDYGVIMPYAVSGTTTPDNVDTGIFDYSVAMNFGQLVAPVASAGAITGYNLTLGSSGGGGYQGIRFTDGTNNAYISASWAAYGLAFVTNRDAYGFEWCHQNTSTCPLSYVTQTDSFGGAVGFQSNSSSATNGFGGSATGVQFAAINTGTSGSSNAIFYLSRTSTSAGAGITWVNGTSGKWDAGMFDSTNDFQVRDESNGYHTVINIPAGTPQNSIGGNSNGATAITQATSDTSTNIATDAFVKANVNALVADTTISIASFAIPANTCYGSSGSSTPATVSMTNLTTSMVVHASYSSNPGSITGWGSSGGLSLAIWPSAAGTASYVVCNSTGSSITGGAITFNIGAS